MVLDQFGASAFAQKKIPFRINFIDFWNTFGTPGSERMESRLRGFPFTKADVPMRPEIVASIGVATLEHIRASGGSLMLSPRGYDVRFSI